eukprot:scaffold1874_cov237-Pinguiococcus_pyrenoidosus.AAC.5
MPSSRSGELAASPRAPLTYHRPSVWRSRSFLETFSRTGRLSAEKSRAWPSAPTSSPTTSSSRALFRRSARDVDREEATLARPCSCRHAVSASTLVRPAFGRRCVGIAEKTLKRGTADFEVAQEVVLGEAIPVVHFQAQDAVCGGRLWLKAVDLVAPDGIQCVVDPLGLPDQLFVPVDFAVRVRQRERIRLLQVATLANLDRDGISMTRQLDRELPLGASRLPRQGLQVRLGSLTSLPRLGREGKRLHRMPETAPSGRELGFGRTALVVSILLVDEREELVRAQQDLPEEVVLRELVVVEEVQPQAREVRVV